MKPLIIPRGIANIFSVGLCDEGSITEKYEHRPDLINRSMKEEIINNYMSLTSPVSATKGKSYKMTSLMFRTYFGGI